MRSFYKLLQTNDENPYTREDIDNITIQRFHRLKWKLQQQKVDINIDMTFTADRQTTVKQKTVDICSVLSQFGYYCDIEWFLSLNLNRSKRLYKKLKYNL